jgi:hypothetical protein
MKFGMDVMPLGTALHHTSHTSKISNTNMADKQDL